MRDSELIRQALEPAKAMALSLLRYRLERRCLWKPPREIAIVVDDVDSDADRLVWVHAVAREEGRIRFIGRFDNSDVGPQSATGELIIEEAHITVDQILRILDQYDWIEGYRFIPEKHLSVEDGIWVLIKSVHDTSIPFFLKAVSAGYEKIFGPYSSTHPVDGPLRSFRSARFYWRPEGQDYWRPIDLRLDEEEKG